jgi:hypothetical protein
MALVCGVMSFFLRSSAAFSKALMGWVSLLGGGGSSLKSLEIVLFVGSKRRESVKLGL